MTIGPDFFMHRRPNCKCELDAEMEREAKEQQRLAAEYSKVLYENSGLNVGEKLPKMTLGNLKMHDGNRQAVYLVKEWLQDIREQQSGLIFAGDPGRGKTHFAAGIVRYAVDHGIRAEFHKSSKFLESLRPQKDIEKQRTVSYYAKLPILAIDDLGKEKLSEWAYEKLFELLDERDNLMKPLIVTTNHTVDTMVRHIGDACVSRIMGSCRWVNLEGADYRVEGEPWWVS
jgi:DNA replication protein DnaC